MTRSERHPPQVEISFVVMMLSIDFFTTFVITAACVVVQNELL